MSVNGIFMYQLLIMTPLSFIIVQLYDSSPWSRICWVLYILVVVGGCFIARGMYRYSLHRSVVRNNLTYSYLLDTYRKPFQLFSVTVITGIVVFSLYNLIMICPSLGIMNRIVGFWGLTTGFILSEFNASLVFLNYLEQKRLVR